MPSIQHKPGYTALQKKADKLYHDALITGSHERFQNSHANSVPDVMWVLAGTGCAKLGPSETDASLVNAHYANFHFHVG